MEKEILARMNNPFVVKLFYSFQTRENLYLVLDYMAGGDVASLLAGIGQLPEDAARRYTAECVLGMGYVILIRNYFICRP